MVSRAYWEVEGAALGIMLRDHLPYRSRFDRFSSKDGFQLPEILPAHAAADVFLRRCKRVR